MTENIWVLIPLAALSVPIFSVIGGNAVLSAVVGGSLGLVAVTLAVRSLMTHRHNLKMEELAAQERIVRAEREQLTAAERILEMDTLGELGRALGRVPRVEKPRREAPKA